MTSKIDYDVEIPTEPRIVGSKLTKTGHEWCNYRAIQQYNKGHLLHIFCESGNSMLTNSHLLTSELPVKRITSCIGYSLS